MTGGIRTTIALALTAMCIGAIFAPATVGAQEGDGDAHRVDTVTVEAKRDVDIEPDLGTISLGVRVHARTAEGATDRLSNRTRRVINAIEGIGFTEDEIDTYGVELQRVCLDKCRDPNPNDKKIPTPVFGYRGSAGVRVETKELDRIGQVIDVGIGAGANSIRGITFEVEDKSAAVQEALRQAMEFATNKARILAETGGRSLGPAIIITEGNTRAPEVYAVPQADRVVAARGTSSSGSTSGGSGGGNAFPIEPPTLSASARVQVTFELN